MTNRMTRFVVSEPPGGTVTPASTSENLPGAAFIVIPTNGGRLEQAVSPISRNVVAIDRTCINDPRVIRTRIVAVSGATESRLSPTAVPGRHRRCVIAVGRSDPSNITSGRLRVPRRSSPLCSRRTKPPHADRQRGHWARSHHQTPSRTGSLACTRREPAFAGPGAQRQQTPGRLRKSFPPHSAEKAAYRHHQELAECRTQQLATPRKLSAPTAPQRYPSSVEFRIRPFVPRDLDSTSPQPSSRQVAPKPTFTRDWFWPRARLPKRSRLGSIAATLLDRQHLRKHLAVACAEVCEILPCLSKRDVIRAGLFVRFADPQTVVLPEANRADLPIAVGKAEIVATGALEKRRVQRSSPSFAE